MAFDGAISVNGTIVIPPAYKVWGVYYFQVVSSSVRDIFISTQYLGKTLTDSDKICICIDIDDI